MELIIPSVDYKDSFIAAVHEYQATESDDRRDIYELDVTALAQDFYAYVRMLLDQSEGKNLPEGYVPQTTLWLVEGEDFIGRVSIRHSLTEFLLREGGHIGYDIRPSRRNRGYGTKILELALPRARVLGIDRVLVTCSETNTGSRKIIEANGGVLENIVTVADGKPGKMRYWITL